MVTVKYFASLRSLAGTGEERFDLGNEATLLTLNDVIGKAHPRLKDMIRDKKILISVNQDMASPDSIVMDGDEVALLPPFSGGSGLI